MSGGRVNSTELVAALINQKSNFQEGIRFAQDMIERHSFHPDYEG
jgi:amidophosphoribosyltransferase